MTVSDDSSVNREKTCPLLLRMFCSTKKHNNVLEYSRGRTPINELQVYTWFDATLRELASLVKQVNPESRRRGTLFDFALVFPDHRSPVYRMRELGTVCSGSPSDTDRIMLKDVQFTIGDMIDVAITPPLTDTNAPFIKNDSLILDSGRRLSKQNNPITRNRRSHEKYHEHPPNSNNPDLESSKYRRHVNNVNLTSQDKTEKSESGKESRIDKSSDGRYNYKVNARRVVPY
ncbi:unnamed protein product [Schistosoma rodhaini]|uniref:18 kDa Sin3-associated polypeptide n=1 Tax=Schistosoma rodhaini TaxID=6188 RepID=A0A183R7S7_9TREM|nr:unnamed protein product [Schistosoma rodhaini]CAH8620272.1 unnamed protein product [Schistosoma rodhaini]